MIEFEIEIEDDRLVPIERSHLMWGRCPCGARALVAEGRTARCSVCALADADGAREPARLAGVTPLGQGYPPAPPVAREAFPAPLVTSRDAWDGSGAPSPVLKLAEKAREASWDVRVQRSRGCAPHAATGRAGAVKWRYAVVLSKDGGRRSAYAVYAETTWASVMLWGADRAWFPAASVSDLAEYVAAGGEMADGWYDAIRRRGADAEVRRKARAQCDRGNHGEARFIDNGLMGCSTCGNEWQSDGEPWRKTKSGSGEAL